jgi:transcription antitermination factor NusG
MERAESASSPPSTARIHPRSACFSGLTLKLSAVGGKTAPTERGEALDSHAWYAIWTRSHSERLVYDQLSALGFSAFLPELGMWSKRQGQMHVVPMPMFPGYLFVRDSMDKHAYIEMLKVRGLVRILENGWTRLTPIPDEEVSSIERVMQAGLPMLPHALHEGDLVRVTEGPLKGVEGVFVQDKPESGRLIVSIGLLGRGIAVEVNCTSITPVSSSSSAKPQAAMPALAANALRN